MGSFFPPFTAISESAVFLGFPDKEMYRVKVDLPLQEIVKAERATSDAVSLSRELFSAIFKEELETSPLEVNCTKTNDKTRILDQDLLRGIRCENHSYCILTVLQVSIINTIGLVLGLMIPFILIKSKMHNTII